MNWGKKILIVYVVFVTGIGFMVYKSASQKADLVTTDYYAKELKYQDTIDEMGRVASLSSPVLFEVRDNELTIQFPKDFAGKQLTGEALLYCPSDENKDFKKDFSVLDEPVKITLPAANKGLHELHLSWKQGNVTYYFEKKIFI